MKSFDEQFAEIETELSQTTQYHPLQQLSEYYNNRPIVLYGCGFFCRLILSVCAKCNVIVSAICDSTKKGAFEDSGYPIITLEELRDKYPTAVVLISVSTNTFSAEIIEQLKGLGFDDKYIVPFSRRYTYSNIANPRQFVQTHLAGYRWAYDFFEDEISKKIVINRVKEYLLCAGLDKAHSGDEYFENGIIALDEDEVFVDGGCFDGGTALAFINNAQGRYKHIYSFEPDIAVLNKAENNLKNHESVDLIAKGLWSESTELKFLSDGGKNGSSRIGDGGAIFVPVVSLDSFFSDKTDDVLPTFIKLDIEGAEKEALIGAESVIRKRHPKLAICAYHKPEDIYELPRLIYQLNPNYRFSLRQYEDGLIDTVLYAVQEDK